jgi:hypothetical protein
VSRDRAIALAVSVYVLMIVATFGPATIESERAIEKHDQACDVQRKPCYFGRPSKADGLMKAIFWPFWLSYKAAEAIMDEEAGQ